MLKKLRAALASLQEVAPDQTTAIKDSEQKIKDKTTPAVAPTTLVDQATLLKRLATIKEQHAAKRPKPAEALEKAKTEQKQDKAKCAKSLEKLLKQYEADKATLTESHKQSAERQAKRVEEANNGGSSHN